MQAALRRCVAAWSPRPHLVALWPATARRQGASSRLVSRWLRQQLLGRGGRCRRRRRRPTKYLGRVHSSVLCD